MSGHVAIHPCFPPIRSARYRPGILLAFLLTLFTVKPLIGDDLPQKIRLLNIQGEVLETPLTSWSDDAWNVTKPEAHEIPMDQVVAVDWLSRSVAPLHRQPQVLLVNGDRIAFTLKSWDEEALTGTGLISPDEPLRIPLEFVKGIILHPLSDLNELALEMQRINTHPAGDDLVALSNGDQVRGQMLRLENGSFLFDRDSTNVSLARGQIRSLSLNPELSVIPPAPEGTSVSLTLTDGSCLTVGNWLRTTDHLTGSWLGSIPLEIPLSAIAGFRPRSPNQEPLEELSPASYRFVPFLNTPEVEFRRDRNTWGGPIALDRRPYPSGLGLRSRSETTWRIANQYKSLIATLGIDDAAGNQGSAVCQIVVDGQVAYTSPPLRGGEPAIQVPMIDVARAQQLQIIVDFGEEGDVLDLVDLCDAILFK